MEENELSCEVIGASIEVHRHIGPGLLESVYRKCLEYELQQRGLQVCCEQVLPVRYKQMEFVDALRIDMLVEGKLIVELKAVDAFQRVYTAQLLSYLRMSGLKLGLLINFNVPRLRDGVKRVVNSL